MIRRIRWRHVVELVGKRGLNRIQRRVRARVDLPLPAETTSAVAADVGAAEVLRLDPGMTHLMHAYAPEPFVGRVTLLNPGVEEPALAELSNFVLVHGWERYVTGPVERWPVVGATHGTMAVEKIEVTAGVFAEVMGNGETMGSRP